MNQPTGKLNLDEAMGRRPEANTEIKPTIRVKRSDLKAMKRHPLPPEKKLAFGIGATAVALALAAVLWFLRDSWLPFWQSVLPESGGSAGGSVPVVSDGGDGAGEAESAVAPVPPTAGVGSSPAAGGTLPPPESLTYFSAAGWNDESFRQAVRHYNAGFDAYRAFLADDTSSRPLAVAETETIESLKLLQEVSGRVPEGMRDEVSFDILEARSLLAEVRRLARDPSASAASAGVAPRGDRKPDAAAVDPGAQPKTWKNPDYLEAARAYNRAVAKYKEFLADKTGKQALLKEIEEDAFSAAKKFESLKASAPAGIPLSDHITQCYKLISDCRRQQLESPSRTIPGPATRAHPPRRSVP